MNQTEDDLVKPFLEYDELIDRLQERGMIIKDFSRARRKLIQVGYYRLSGYWFTARQFQQDQNRKRTYLDSFRPETTFEDVFDLYLFDKRLRIEFTDALERIEIFFSYNHCS